MTDHSFKDETVRNLIIYILSKLLLDNIKMNESQQQLSEAAYDLGIEIHEGKWNHIPDIHKKPAPACIEIVNELRNRCPGFTNDQYQRAIATGLFESMK